MYLQTLIEANVDVKTTDGYLLRVFCIGFTRKQPNQIKKTAYAKSSQTRIIRRKMVEIMQREISEVDMKEVVTKLYVVELIVFCQIIIICAFFYRIPDSIGRDIEKKCQSIFPLHDVLIRKVKVLKKPRFDG